MIESESPDQTLRVWVPGCATGEEAYSIAMFVQEQLAAQDKRLAVKIFATDVDQEVVDFGAAGLYPGSIAADVPQELLARYFVSEAGAFRISRRIREQVVFARQNVLRDPPFTKMDLISCRNLLIYLQPEWQRKVMTLFHFALRPGGHLFLGSSEAIGERHEAFEVVDAKARIFQKRADVAPGIGGLVSGLGAAQAMRFNKSESVPRGGAQAAKARQADLWESLGAELFTEFVPTCLVLNARHEIVHSFGRPERFIALRAGEPSLDLIKLAPRELALALAHTIRRAEKTRQPISSLGVRFQRDGAPAVIDLTVKPLPAAPGQNPLLLVFFHEPKSAPDTSAQPAEAADPASQSTERISDLEEDLRSARDELQSAIVDKDASNEELQAANEEMLASNEELQSSNEELESVNEELTTLNSEFQQKIAELTVSNNDVENFLRTSDVATIFLDASLHIRRFTPAAARELRLLPHDTGRLLTDLRHPIIDALAADFPRVAAAGGEPVLKTVETSPGIWHLLRITPFRREGASDQGLVITILDVSALHRDGQG